MKVRLTSYTFDASEKTVTAGQFSDVGLAGIQLIVNVTDQIIIYNFADTAKGGTLSTDTLTLEYDTTSMSDADELMILVEDGVVQALPTGASTSAKQDTVIGHLDGVEGLLTTIDGDTGNISTKIDTLAGAVSGTEVQVDVLTMPTTTVQATNLDIRDLTNTDVVTAELSATDNAVLDAIAASVAAIDTDATTIIGHVDGLETSNSAIQTAVELLDDAVYVDDTATHSTGTSKGIGIMAAATPTDTSISANDIGMVAMTTDRQLLARATVASGGIASGAVASGAIASGAIASGAIASGAIAAGAIAAGATSIATTEDTASAAADHLVKVAQIRLDTPVSGANVSNSGDYTQFIADSFGKTWVTGTYAEDLAHVAGEPIVGLGARRIDTPATSSGTSGDWSTVNQSAEGGVWTTQTPSAIGGLSVFNATSSDGATALTSTAQAVKASAGQVYGWYIYNPNATAQFVQIYNTAQGSVTVGTTNPLFMLTIPATSAANVEFTNGIQFSTAIAIAGTSTAGGNGAPGTALDAVIFYK